MTPKTTELQEIEIIEYPDINAKDLRIIKHQPKKYSPAERRLRPAQYTYGDLVGIVGGQIPLDPIIYYLTGKTKKLKNDLKVERKLFFIADLLKLYDENYFINTLKINADHVGGFVFYLAEDESFRNKYQRKDFKLIEWKLTNYAIIYNHLIADENKSN